jgi:hypothetical protein
MKYLELTSGNSAIGSRVLSKGSHAVIKSVNLFDAKGQATDYYVPGTPFCLDVNFKTDGTKDMSIDLFLTDVNQARLAFFSLYQYNGIALPVKPGNYVCKLRLQPMELASGAYKLDISTAIANKCWDHQVEGILNFTVPYSTPNGKSWHFRYSDGYGACAWLNQGTPEMAIQGAA